MIFVTHFLTYFAADFTQTQLWWTLISQTSHHRLVRDYSNPGVRISFIPKNIMKQSTVSSIQCRWGLYHMMHTHQDPNIDPIIWESYTSWKEWTLLWTARRRRRRWQWRRAEDRKSKWAAWPIQHWTVAKRKSVSFLLETF